MEKFFLKSKTIVGALLTFAVVVSPALGFTFTDSDGALISQLVDQIIVACTTALTIWGRFTAEKQIKVIPSGVKV